MVYCWYNMHKCYPTVQLEMLKDNYHGNIMASCGADLNAEGVSCEATNMGTATGKSTLGVKQHWFVDPQKRQIRPPEL